MTILHLRTLIGLSTQRAETEIRFLDIAGTCNTLVNSKGIGRKVRVKEPMLAINKLVLPPIKTRS